MQAKLDQTESLHLTLEPTLKKLEYDLAVAKSTIDTLQKDNVKMTQERDVSRDQNKKLVDLLQRMEKKMAEKTKETE